LITFDCFKKIVTVNRLVSSSTQLERILFQGRVPLNL